MEVIVELESVYSRGGGLVQVRDDAAALVRRLERKAYPDYYSDFVRAVESDDLLQFETLLGKARPANRWVNEPDDAPTEVAALLALSPWLGNILHLCVEQGFDAGVHIICEPLHRPLALRLIQSRDKFGETPLHIAARLLNISSLRMLLDCYDNGSGSAQALRAVDRNSKTVLHLLLVRLKTRWSTCARLARPLEPTPNTVVDLALAALSRDAHPNDILLAHDSTGLSCLDHALTLGHVGVLAALLERLEASRLAAVLPGLLRDSI